MHLALKIIQLFCKGPLWQTLMKKDAYIIVCVQVNFLINQSSILNECMTDSDCNDTDVSLVVEVLLISSTYFKFNTCLLY